MTARQLVVAALEAALAPQDVTVMAYSRSVDNIARNTVMVRVDEVRPSTNPQAFREYTFALLVLVPQTEPGVADAELDALLEDVLHAIDQSDLPVWTLASRASFEERFPAYEIALTIHVTKES